MATCAVQGCAIDGLEMRRQASMTEAFLGLAITHVVCMARRSAPAHPGPVDFDVVVPARLARLRFEGTDQSAPFVFLAVHLYTSTHNTTADILRQIRGVDAHSGTLPIFIGEWNFVHPAEGRKQADRSAAHIHMSRARFSSAACSRKSPMSLWTDRLAGSMVRRG